LSRNVNRVRCRHYIKPNKDTSSPSAFCHANAYDTTITGVSAAAQTGLPLNSGRLVFFQVRKNVILSGNIAVFAPRFTLLRTLQIFSSFLQIPGRTDVWN
jgi:hypothetical protein